MEYYYNIYIYIYIYIFRKKWVEYDRMYIEKVKSKKNMFDDLFICQSILTWIFFGMQKCFNTTQYHNEKVLFFKISPSTGKIMLKNSKLTLKIISPFSKYSKQ